MKLRGVVPNFYIHVCMSDLYIHTIGPQMQYSKIGGLMVRSINRYHKHFECTLEIGNKAVQFYFWKFLFRIFGTVRVVLYEMQTSATEGFTPMVSLIQVCLYI
jgi:hypothetical protein